MTQNLTRSLEYLEAAHAAQGELQRQYDLPHQDNKAIAALHQQIGFAFKSAEVHASLAVAQELRRLTLRAFPTQVAS